MNLYFHGLYKSYGGKTVLANISGAINGKDKIGLVGVNGIGKSTLAEILAGRKAMDSGEIEYSPADARILYIEQYPKFAACMSVFDVIYRIAWQEEKSRQDVTTTVKKALNQVGLKEEKWEQQAQNLSGGERTKLSLCRALVRDFDLLILDEPTNHLDIESSHWVEQFAQSLKKPLLVISHDRYFLDQVVNKIWELTGQGLKVYEGNYSAYKKQKEIELANMTKEYNKQQAKIQQLKAEINERANWYRRAHKGAGKNDYYRSRAKKHARVLKAKQKELERIEKVKIDKPKKPLSPAFEVINKNILGKKLPQFLVQGKNLTKSFGEKLVFKDVSFNIRRGDRIALIGPNGAGKTTLLKTICQLEKNYRGTININPSVKIGYFAQQLENLNQQATVLEDVLTVETTAAEARLLLACLLFRGDDVYKKIADLSMGEKGRVAFAKLILSGANLLVLDEPTNYMDIVSKERIEDTLEEYKGSILFVSHDRYLIDRLANRIFVIADQKLHCYEGNYRYYLSKYSEQQKRKELGNEYRSLTNSIRKLECELAFLSGKLNEELEEEEKEKLNARFLTIAEQLRQKKEKLNKQK